MTRPGSEPCSSGPLANTQLIRPKKNPKKNKSKKNWHYHYYYFTFLRIFPTSICWWFLTGFWMTASFLKSPGLFSVFLSISTILNFGWSPHFKSSSTNPLVTVPRVPITISYTVTFIFRSFFFSIPSKVQVLLFLFVFFQFYSVVYQNSTLSTQSCLVFDTFCVNLPNLLIIRLIDSPLSPYNLHLLFCCVLSILVLIWFLLMALFCAAIRRDLVSLLRLVFSAIFSPVRFRLVCHLKCPKRYFPSNLFFLFTSVLLMIVLPVSFSMFIINFPLCLCMQTSSLFIDMSTLF